MAPVRVVAVDWSGAVTGAARKIWLAEVAGGDVVRLVGGRERAVVVEDLAGMVRDAASTGAMLAIGLDFAFALPAWFAASVGAADGPALWATATRDGERWLRCEAPPVGGPFWGRHGTRHPPVRDHEPALRATERAVAAATGCRPSSAFKLVGPDQVGAASVRGMPALAALRAAGAVVWPFDDAIAGCPVVVEIWPRVLYAERVTKSRVDERAAYLARHAPALSADVRAAATASDDAFDALTAALAMWAHRKSLGALPPACDAVERLEGRIWVPGV